MDEVKARANQTVRVCVTNLQTLAKGNLVARYMQGYRDAIDYMYSDEKALAAYEDFAKIPAERMRTWRDEYFPKATLLPDEIKGLDLVLSDALKNKFISAPLRRSQIRTMVQIPKPLR